MGWNRSGYKAQNFNLEPFKLNAYRRMRQALARVPPQFVREEGSPSKRDDSMVRRLLPPIETSLMTADFKAARRQASCERPRGLEGASMMVLAMSNNELSRFDLLVRASAAIFWLRMRLRCSD